MLVKNPTKYVGDYTKLYNVVLDKGSFPYESSLRLSYYQRLYYELLYTKKVNGIALYYTLTYCDAKVPKFLGRNVHSYADVRKVTNGFLSKVLFREYGSRLRYFCACECGEGGTEQHHARGFGNNPHYHFIFFVQPVHDKSGFPVYDDYRRITVDSFTKLIRGFWLGKSEGYYDYKHAAYGIVEPGSLGAEISTPECFSYVVKYVIKDVVALQTDHVVYMHYYNDCLSGSVTFDSLYQYYQSNKHSIAGYDRKRFFTEFSLHDYWFQRHYHITSLSYSDWVNVCGSEWLKSNVVKFKHWFEQVYCDMYARSRLREFTNNYGPKVRISNGLGEYGLKFIQDVSSSPRLVFNYCGNMVSQYPCLYYIRKLYYTIQKCPYTGNPLYRLNELGLDLRCNQLLTQLENFRSDLYECISYVLLNDVQVPHSFDSVTYQQYLDELVEGNEPSFECYEGYGKKKVRELCSLHDYEYILRCYSVYCLVYRYRCYRSRANNIMLDSSLLPSDILSDYRFFLQSYPSFLDYDECGVFALCLKNPDMLGFDSYYVFAPYLDCFNLLDSVTGVVHTIQSDNKKRLFNDSSEHQKRINVYKMNISCNI